MQAFCYVLSFITVILNPKNKISLFTDNNTIVIVNSTIILISSAYIINMELLHERGGNL